MLDRNAHIKLSYFGFSKPLDCSNLQEDDFSIVSNRSGALQSDGRAHTQGKRQEFKLTHVIHFEYIRRVLVYKPLKESKLGNVGISCLL